MQQRDNSNLTAIKKMFATLEGQLEIPEQQPEYLLALASLWQQTLAIL
ncbi:hypothetical protein PCIT_a2751 [Pseudoalteromonas citrea]|uniref:Uncharacterized protein n=2 Tax=Pseudoalteromonas citrea TaxID=43655 RepID=A0AAD4AHI5_9GAMM|nr:hypothetical protein [Pseudoalteromonas citrea]KAF7769842.1 hypothetical protein PCIT_a2751 [Pseudoalteromonas citrea]